MTASSLPIEIIETSVTRTSSTVGADYYIRQLIYANKDTQTQVTSFYKEVLRFLKTLFSSFSVIDSQGSILNVKCYHSLSERAIAAQRKANTLIFPIMGISLSRTENASIQSHYNAKISNESYWDDKKQRAIRIVSLVPKPVRLIYLLEIEANYLEHLDQLSEQIQRTFNPYIELNTPFTKYGAVSIDTDFVQSEQNIPSGEDRTQVRTYEVVVETHIPSPKFLMTSTGQLELLKVEAQIDSEQES
jgi:hypothetical protein